MSDNIDIYTELCSAVIKVRDLCEKYNIDSFIDIYHSKNENHTSIDFDFMIEC